MSALAVSLTVDELRALIREEVQAAVGDKPKAVGAPSEVLTRIHVAELLDVDAHQIPKLIKQGLPAHPFGKKQYRFLRAEVLAWMASHKERT